MTSKRLLTTIFFLLAGISFSQAQNSASATMQVSVTVIEGASLQVSDGSPSIIQHENCSGNMVNFGNVRLAHSKGQNIDIERPKEITLKNEQGELFTYRRMPAEEQISKDGLSFQMNYAEKEHAEHKEGNYKGSVTTSIAYN